MAGWLLLLPVLTALLVFFVAPLLGLAAESFRRFSLTGGVGGFTLANYQRLLLSSYYLTILGNTFRLAAFTALFCLVLAYPFAMLLRAAPNRMKGLLVIGIIAPLLVSVVVRTFGWIVVLGEFGLVNRALNGLGLGSAFSARSHLFNEPAVLIGLVHVFLPFMVLAIYAALQTQPPRLERAARNLGATPLRAFLTVTLPLSLPGIVAGTMTVFAMAAGSYVTVAVLGGSKVIVMSILAYQQGIGLSNWPLGAAIGIVLLLGMTVLLQAFRLTMRRAFARFGEL